MDDLNTKGPFLATFKSGIFVISQGYVRDMSGICQGFICLDMGGHPGVILSIVLKQK